MKFLPVTLLLIVAVFFSCSSEQQGNITPNGYEIVRLKSGDGVKPAVGDYVFAQLYAYVDGVLETSTRQQHRQLPVIVYSKEELLKMKETGKANPVYDAISMMGVGDSISVDVPITEEMRQNPRFASSQKMHYDIVVEELKTAEEYKNEQEAAKQAQQKISSENQARESEVAAVVSDIAAKYGKGQLKDQLKTTSSGLKYMILEPGDGPATTVGQDVSVNYYGVLTNGSMFDNSFKRGQAFTFPLGAGRVIKGWDEGVALLKSGDHAVLFIPSELGYGKRGSGAAIPGDSELIFYIEVM